MPTRSQTFSTIEPPVGRALLEQEDLAVYELDLDGWRATDNGQAKLGDTAGTPSGAFGVTVGTHGSAAPQIVGEAASGTSKTNKMRRQFTLPPEYVAGQSVTLRIIAKETIGAATVETTVDVKVRKVGAEAAVGSELYSGSDADVTTTVGNKDFAIDAASLAPGDQLDIEITGLTDDTGATVGTVLAIYRTQLLLDIKG